MDRSYSFMHGVLTGAGVVIGAAALTWGALAVRMLLRRPPTAPNYAYLR